jgi:hypothetical protein
MMGQLQCGLVWRELPYCTLRYKSNTTKFKLQVMLSSFIIKYEGGAGMDIDNQ